MGKAVWKPGTVLYPVPAVMVSCGTMEEKNIITVAWTGTINSGPAMTYISVRRDNQFRPCNDIYLRPPRASFLRAD